ncbi:MAG: HAMP domain-containing histidine kinase [Elusimicrobia bacterium]|nr:HAMP domain-containing histidine kinase [Elusimicrobiota bacterium]
MKLYHKLNAALVITALLSAGLLSFIFFRFQRSGIIANELQKISLTAQGVKNILAEANLARDPLMLVDYLSNLYAYHPEIAAIETFNGKSWQPVRPRAAKAARAGYPHPSSLIPSATQHGGPPPIQPGGHSAGLFGGHPSKDGPPEEFRAGDYGARLYLSRKYLLQERSRLLAELLRRLLYSLAAAVCVSALLALVLNFHLTRRLRALSAETKVLGEGRFGHKVDISGSDEIAQLAANFNAMSQKLLELETIKKDFTASVTHELRSPLGAIESHVSLLLRTRRPKAEKESLERIKANAGRLANFVTSLLDLAKIERGKMDLHKTRADPCALARDVTAFFKPKAAENGLTLDIAAEPGRPISLDRELLAHVFTNLISNAIKFTPAGGRITVSAGFSPDGKIFRARVTDSGRGIPPEDRGKLFSVFGQASSVDAAGGTGLGLALAKGIIDMHKGRIGFDSEPGAGSDFWFEIPANPSAYGGREG